MDSAIDDDVVISLSGVSKCFRRYGKPIDRLKEVILSKKDRAEEFWVLNNLNLEVKRGETLGIIGQNGSGKSTLLQMIAGTMQPTTGSLKVRGQVSALLELGSGFNPEFTGRQNVFFNGRILGLSQEEIENRFDTIAAFADIGDYIDQPVKTYSSGMFVRLAFAVAVHVDSEIFIVDEALAVGDVMFQHRCMRKIKSLMDSGITTLFVSHDSAAVKALCSRAVMLYEGKIFAAGHPDQVMNQYLKKITDLEMGYDENNLINEETKPSAISAKSEIEGVSQDSLKTINLNLLSQSSLAERLEKSLSGMNFSNASQRGSGKVEILGVAVLDYKSQWAGSNPSLEFGQDMTIAIRIRAKEAIENCIFGFLLRDKNGYEILGFNTHEESVSIQNLQWGDEIEVAFTFEVAIRPGSYSLSVAVTESYTSVTAIWLDNILVLQVMAPLSGRQIFGVIDLPVQVGVRRLHIPLLANP